MSITLYGIVYIAGFLLMLFFPEKLFKLPQTSFWYRLYISSYAAIGAIVGGRLGYILIYEPEYYIDHLQEIPRIYLGGMSFHGGLIGLYFALFISDHKNFLSNLDRCAVIATVIIMLGRIANFINGELWGTTTDLPWGVVFTAAGNMPRHPVQLYEAIAEGPLAALVIWIILKYLAKKHKYKSTSLLCLCPGLAASIYGAWYGFARTFTEIFREPDSVVGLLPGHFTVGQILSLAIGILCTILSVILYKSATQVQTSYATD